VSGIVLCQKRLRLSCIADECKPLVPGLANNTRYTDSYGFTRISYNDADFDFAANFTDKYLQAGPEPSTPTLFLNRKPQSQNPNPEGSYARFAPCHRVSQK
jgi:hypothetical protein